MASVFKRRLSRKAIWLLFLCSRASSTPASSLANANLNLNLSPTYAKKPFHGINATTVALSKATVHNVARASLPDEYIERVYDNPEFCCTGQYAIPLSIGSLVPNRGLQGVRLLMDTGSSELWSFKDCDSFPSGYVDLCRNNSIYNPSLSSSAVHLDDRFQIKYLAVSVSGSRYRDSMCLWDTDTCFRNVSFGVVSSANVNPKTVMVSGVLGLGFGAPNPFLQAMLDQGVMGSPFFSLTIDQPDDINYAGDIIFGGIDRMKFTGPLVRVNSRSDMNFDVKEMGISRSGSIKTYSADHGPFDCTLDTGNKALWLPKPVYQAFMADIFPGVTEEIFPRVNCDVARRSNASLHFGFGATLIDIPVSKLVVATSSGGCRLLLAGQLVKQGQWWCSLGTSMLYDTYAVFDHQTPALYFARATYCGEDIVAPKVVNGVHGSLDGVKGLC